MKNILNGISYGQWPLVMAICLKCLVFSYSRDLSDGVSRRNYLLCERALQRIYGSGLHNIHLIGKERRKRI